MAKKLTEDLWDRSKDGSNREPRSFFRFAIILTAVFVIFLFLKKDNVIRWIQAGFTHRSQRRQIEAVEAENARLDRQIELLSTNRDSLETYARERFYFSKEGEDVYIIEP